MPGKAVTVTATYVDVPVVHMVTVVDGANADGESEFTASEGDKITVTAAAAPEGKAFDKWVSDDIEIGEDEAKAATLEFTMPGKAVTVTATYVDVPVEDNITVVLTAPETYKSGMDVTFTCKVEYVNMPKGMGFTLVQPDNWSFVSDTSGAMVKPSKDDTGSLGWAWIEIPALPYEFTFTLHPSDAVKDDQTFQYGIDTDDPVADLEITIKPVDPDIYTVKVIDGTNADGESEFTASEGNEIKVMAVAASDGFVFDKWMSDDVEIVDATEIEASFTMPANDVTITATYKPVYKVTVVNGTSDGKTERIVCAGDTIVITADAPAEDNQSFRQWKGEVEFTDPLTTTTTFPMPAKDVTVTATYRTRYTITLEIGENGIVQDVDENDWIVDGTTLMHEFYDLLDEDLALPIVTGYEDFKFLGWYENETRYKSKEKITAGLDRSLTLVAKYYDGMEYVEWPENTDLYEPADGKLFREASDLAVTFSWPAILNADHYRLVIATYGGNVVFDDEVDGITCTVADLQLGSFTWGVTAIGDYCEAGTSPYFHFAVIEDNGVPVIKDAQANGTAIEFTYDKEESGYREGVFTYQIFFYSLTTNTWTSITQNLSVANGKAVINLGVNTSNGYLYICPVTQPESNFVELYIK